MTAISAQMNVRNDYYIKFSFHDSNKTIKNETHVFSKLNFDEINMFYS